MEELQIRILNYIDRWITLRENNISITEYCEDVNAKTVAIYGYGKLGRHLLWELQNNGFLVPWIMDKRYDEIKLKDDSIKILPPLEIKEIPAVDMIIVTALSDFREIEAELSKHTECIIVSIDDIIERIEEKNRS